MTDMNLYVTDDMLKKKSYNEFKLDRIAEHNLKDIEKTIKENKINDDNRQDIIGYLEKLYKQIAEIKKNEYDYEGEHNLNVNECLDRIKRLLIQVRQ